MPFFGRRHYDTTVGHGHAHGPSTHHERRGFHLFHTRNPARVDAGYRAALANPNTTREGRRHAKDRLHERGMSAHVPLMTKIKRTLGIRSTPRRHAHHTDRY